MLKPGSVPPIFYFVNHQNPQRPEGYIELAPYSAAEPPPGYSREYVDTLPGVDRLQERLTEQYTREAEAEYEMDQARWARVKDRVRDSLYAKMTSGSTPPYEREFIRLYLQLREEKRKKYRDIWLQRTMYLYVREMDQVGDRDPSKEEFDPNKLHLPSNP
jgi:hypothetical protein